jgi:hypothetical protein
MAGTDSKKMIEQSAESWSTVDELVRQSKDIIPLEKYKAIRTEVAKKASTSRNGFRRVRDRTPKPPPERGKEGEQDAEDALRNVLDDVADYEKAGNE